MRLCLLCDKPAGSREHYIPAWLSRETGRGKDPIIIGTAANGEMIYQQFRGCALAATHKNLCHSCNNKLGQFLEGNVHRLLTPLVQPAPIPEWVGYLNSLLKRERDLMAWWTILRAIQLNEQFAEPRILPAVKALLLPDLCRIRDSDIPPLPKGYFVEVAHASTSEWGFQLTRQLFERERGVVERKDSFLWAMQANHCILLGALAPEARPTKDRGWGYGIVPHDAQKCPSYQNIKEFLENTHIDVRLPKLYGVDLGRIFRRWW
jgi:hypothetical protein